MLTRSAGRSILTSLIIASLAPTSASTSAQTCTPFESQKLTASDAEADDHFGVSLSADGDFVVIGARFDSDAGPRSGSAYVFIRDDQGTPSDVDDDAWVQAPKLTASDASAQDRFGVSVSSSDNRIVVGSRFDDDLGVSSGSAYVFRRNDNGTPDDPTDDEWLEEAKLTASDGEAGDVFGISVAISSRRLVVGAFYDVHNGIQSGSAYVFRHEDNGTPRDESDDFWVEEAKLVPDDAAANDRFGKFVAMSGDRAIIGSKRHAALGTDAGAAYVFRVDDMGTPPDRSDDVWFQEGKLFASDAEAYDLFGTAVSIDGDWAAVSAFDDHAGSGSGSVYIFHFSDVGTPLDPSDDIWVQQEKLTASDAAAGDYFGVSTAIRGNACAVGAFFDGDAGYASGSAYLFRRNENETPLDTSDDYWEQEQKWTASDAKSEDHFGSSVGLAGEVAFVSAVTGDSGGAATGSAYAFIIKGGCNCNGIPDERDIANGTSRDVDGNGIPDECAVVVPVVSEWGLAILMLLVLTGGTLVTSHQCGRADSL